MVTKIIVAALSTVGITGTAGFLLHEHLSKETIRSKLQERTDSEIIEGEETNWQSIITDNEGDKKSGLQAFVKKYSSSADIEQRVESKDLKEACEKALEQTAYEDSVEETKTYCTKRKVQA